MTTRINPQALRDTYWLRGGLSAQQARELVGVDRRTWRRWETGSARIPHAAFELLRIIAAGELPAHAGREWQGFAFRAGLLYSPEGWEISAGDVRALVFQRINGMLYCLGNGACRQRFAPRKRRSRLRLVG